MKLESLYTYADVALVLAAEALGSVLYTRHRAALLVVGAATALGFFRRCRKETPGSNMLPLKKLSLSIYATWIVWLAWGALAPRLQHTAFWVIVQGLQGVLLVSLSLYLARNENESFVAFDDRAKAFTAAVLLLSTAPFNLAAELSLLALYAQSAVHALFAYSLFFLRIKKETHNTNISGLFIYTLWVLATIWVLAVPVATVMGAVAVRDLAPAMRPQPEDDPEDPRNTAIRERVFVPLPPPTTAAPPPVLVKQPMQTTAMAVQKPRPAQNKIPTDPRTISQLLVRTAARSAEAQRDERLRAALDVAPRAPSTMTLEGFSPNS